MDNGMSLITKEFEGNGVGIIIENNEILFELYSTGMALGQVRINSIGKGYPRKDRIDQNLINADIKPCVRNGHKYLTEEMLYDLMLEMKTDKVKPFRKWVTSVVLPSIRKHGAYMTENAIEKALTSPDFLIQLATKLKEEQEARKLAESKLEEQRPLVTFAETCIKSKDNILVRQLSKIANDEGIDIGEKRLYTKLRNWGLIMKTSTEPYQYAMDREWFVVEEKSVDTPYGTKLTRTTKVTPKGQVYIIEKLKKELEN